MVHYRKYLPSLIRIFKIIFIIVWLSNLATTDAYISVYALIAFSAFFSVINKKEILLSRGERNLLMLISLIFSVLVLIANYPIFSQVRDLAYIQSSTNFMVNVLNTCFSFIGGVVVSYSLLAFLYDTVRLRNLPECRSSTDRAYTSFVLTSFFIILCINLIHLLFVEYPGNVTEDPFTQIDEMVLGQYSNFNTFWHTMILKTCLSVGYSLFGNINAAVAFFCVFQSVIMAASFAFCLGTLYLIGASVGFLVSSFLIYAILPYNIALSITIWKDVLFSAGALVLITAIFRLIYGFGRCRFLNYVALIFGGFLFGLSRNNGWYVLLASLLVFIWPLRSQKKLLAVLISVFSVCWILTNPLLSVLNVADGDYTEGLSVPLQQVSRVIVEDCELTEDEIELISYVLDIDEVPVLYTNWLSDPIKVEFRSNDTQYFEDHIGEYIKLWFNLGVRYPGTYLRAWVDQTKGYWNGGYGYGMYSETVIDNPYGVEKINGNNLIASLFRLYFGLSRHVIFFEPFHSIGLHVWITAVCCLFNAMQKRKEWILSVPLLVIVIGLCFGTPVYASFRYAYPVFVCIPFIVGTTMYRSVVR